MAPLRPLWEDDSSCSGKAVSVKLKLEGASDFKTVNKVPEQGRADITKIRRDATVTRARRPGLQGEENKHQFVYL